MGGGSSQPKNTTTTTKTELPAWLANSYQQFFNQTNQVNAKPYQSYGGSLNAAPNEFQNDAGALAQMGANYQLPGQSTALNGLTNLINGAQNVKASANPYLGMTTNVGTNAYSGSNPYLESMVNNSNRNITDSYNQNAVPALAAQFATGGAFGGSAMQQAAQSSQDTLAKNLAQSTDSLRYQDYTSQQQLAEAALNRSVAAQQTDLARNSALSQQDWQNQLSAAQQNSANVINGSTGLNAANAIQSQYNQQLNQFGQVQQDYAQGNIDQAYNDWYQQNYGYDQQRLANFGNALNSTAGQFAGSATSGLNPAYKPRTVGGAVASGAGGAAAGGALGAAIAGGSAGSVAPGWGTAIGAGIGLASYYL
jgi:hypothetical protein